LIEHHVEVYQVMIQHCQLSLDLGIFGDSERNVSLLADRLKLEPSQLVSCISLPLSPLSLYILILTLVELSMP